LTCDHINKTDIPKKHSQSFKRLRIIVLGYVVRGPLGGFASYHLQYVIGLSRLGHDVYFVEDSDDYPSCYNPLTDVTDTNPTYGLKFAKHVFKKVGLGDRWAYYDAHTSRWHGPCAERTPGICKTSDLFLNIGGANPLRPWLMNVPVRALIDLDPVFTQIRHITDSAARNRALQHTTFFTVGENIPHNRSTVPDDGLPWQATRQPLVLDAWPLTQGPDNGKFTTVMLWDSYPACELDGMRYGLKSESFTPYMDLPAHAGPIFNLAMGSSTAPLELLGEKGWLVHDSRVPTRDPLTYQRFIQNSKAEFSVAKHGYVITRCGWFSDRSVAYLASGRPVLLQETGFSDWLKTAAGVIPFTTPEEALAGIEEINSRYDFHCRIAREIVEEYFDANKVLARLIESAMTNETSYISLTSKEQKDGS
jgi:hypothetical protein